MVFGELVTNAVRHAPGPIDIRVQSDLSGRVMLDVFDTGPSFTIEPSLPPETSESGRGLYITACLCPHVSATPTPTGNKVSAVLPVNAKAAKLHLVENNRQPDVVPTSPKAALDAEDAVSLESSAD